MAMQPSIVQLKPPEAHSDKQKFIMQALSNGSINEVWVACGTKFGKSLSAAVAISSAAWRGYNHIYRWVAPIYTQSKIGLSYCQQIFPSSEVEINNSQMQITIPNNNTMIQFYHAQNPVSLEGYGIHGYVFDEAAKMKEDAYASAKTTTTVTRGTMVFASTPWGKNWFYRRCMEAKEEMLRAHHEKRLPRKIFITARTEDNPHVPRETIEIARKELPGRLFRQFFLAEFEDDGGVFTGYRDCIYTDHIDVFGDFVQWFNDGCKNSSVVIGADWAKAVDYTVFFAVDVATRKVVGFMRFHKKPYTEAIKNLVRFSKNFKEVLCVYHDKTGVGMAIDDQMGYTGLPFMGINFSNSSKSQMVTNLMTAFEQKQIFIPMWHTLLSEIESFEVTAGAMGQMHYAAAQGGHDDTIASLMLANAALGYYGNISFEVSYADEGSGKLTDLERYYQDLED
jgi:hypothetical protein